MVVSNEPGYYEPGAFGIRLENLLVARSQPVAGGTASAAIEPPMRRVDRTPALRTPALHTPALHTPALLTASARRAQCMASRSTTASTSALSS